MKGFILGVIITLVVLYAGFYIFVSQGMFPIGADNPPGKMERKYANMAMDEYVDKHKPNVENPIPADSPNLMQGAMLYEKHCALCHGGGKDRTSPLAHNFSPPVPQIIQRIPHDEDAHLWWVTKHGIRMTGMPSWDGVLSDDDMWKVIAFVKHSDKLPPDVQAMWQQAAQGPSTTNEVTPKTSQPATKKK